MIAAPPTVTAFLVAGVCASVRCHNLTIHCHPTMWLPICHLGLNAVAAITQQHNVIIFISEILWGSGEGYSRPSTFLQLFFLLNVLISNRKQLWDSRVLLSLSSSIWHYWGGEIKGIFFQVWTDNWNDICRNNVLQCINNINMLCMLSLPSKELTSSSCKLWSVCCSADIFIQMDLDGVLKLSRGLQVVLMDDKTGQHQTVPCLTASYRLHLHPLLLLIYYSLETL